MYYVKPASDAPLTMIIGEAHLMLKGYGLDESEWGQRIITAEKRGLFTLDDKRLARSWTTCACGKLDDGIPRRTNNSPNDIILGSLGLDFWENVQGQKIVPAANTLCKIEARAAQVLKKVNHEHATSL